jgi:cardiolipin synthase
VVALSLLRKSENFTVYPLDYLPLSAPACQTHNAESAIPLADSPEVDATPVPVETHCVNEIWQEYCLTPHRITQGNVVELLRDGVEAFPAMLEAIEGAKTFASLETYIFQPDQIGTRFRDALAAASRRGVEVRVIYDAIGSFDTDDTFWAPLSRAGGYTLPFHPLRAWRRRGWPAHLNKRNHRKLLVVDGSIAFCGGINIHDEELPQDQGGASWRDTHVRIRGPLVRNLHRLFLRTWNYEKGPGPQGLHLLPWPDQQGTVQASAVGTQALKKRRSIHRAYLHAIKQANRFIYLSNPYFIPGRGVRRALANAARRGVDIRVIVPARGDIAAVQFASRKLYGRLMARGVRIFEWPEHVMHAKCGVIDGLWSTVGSFNLDHRSLLHNLELNVMIYGPEFGAQMVAMFEQDLKQCAEVDRHSWDFRPMVDRALETFFYFFRYWL